MTRASWLFATTTVLAVAASAWLYREVRSLRAELDDRAPSAAVIASATTAPAADPWAQAALRSAALPAVHRAVTPPSLTPEPDESKLDRRARRRQEFAAMFGRADGESAADYKARISPLIEAGLAIPRSRAEDMRKEAEAKAHVTPEQSKALDHALDKTYGDALDFANHAIADGSLSPYQTNVAGMLDYAGGLGGLLGDANGQIGQILSADQQKTMSDSGFEWGEYHGAEAPWEKLDAPPPPKPAPGG